MRQCQEGGTEAKKREREWRGRERYRETETETDRRRDTFPSSKINIEDEDWGSRKRGRKGRESGSRER